jgi:hypothetical protein
MGKSVTRLSVRSAWSVDDDERAEEGEGAPNEIPAVGPDAINTYHPAEGGDKVDAAVGSERSPCDLHRRSTEAPGEKQQTGNRQKDEEWRATVALPDPQSITADELA